MENRKKTFGSKTILQICGPTFGILFFVFMILISGFLVREKKEAQVEFNEQLMNDAKEYADDISSLYDKIMSVNSLITNALTKTDMEKNDYEYYSELLSSTIDDIYLVAIVNSNGVGTCSGINDEVNLSAFDYFENVEESRVLFVENDGLLGRKAMVFVMPIIKNEKKAGLIYTYVEVKELEKRLPVKNYDKETYLALVDDTGKIVFGEGQSALGRDGNLFVSLETMKCKDVTPEKIASRISNGVKQSVNISNDDEERVFISYPIEVCDWTYVEAVNVSYVENHILKVTKESYDMAKRILVALISTLIVTVLLFAHNKMRTDEQNRMLENKADTDLLTGVNNKLATERKIQEYLDLHPNEQSLFILLDIDNFKKINDTKGHAFGDLVLKSLGEQLSKEFRSSDIIGRIGGDEFVILLKNLNSDELIQKESKRLLKFFEDFSAGDYVKYSPTASIGGAVFSKDGKDFKSLYKAADAGLYAAKKNGKNQMVFYSKELSNSGRDYGK